MPPPMKMMGTAMAATQSYSRGIGLSRLGTKSEQQANTRDRHQCAGATEYVWLGGRHLLRLRRLILRLAVLRFELAFVGHQLRVIEARERRTAKSCRQCERQERTHGHAPGCEAWYSIMYWALGVVKSLRCRSLLVRRSASNASISALRRCERHLWQPVPSPRSGDESIRRGASNERLLLFRFRRRRLGLCQQLLRVVVRRIDS